MTRIFKIDFTLTNPAFWAPLRSFAKKNKFQKSEITMEVGGGSTRSHSEFFCVENRPKISLNQFWYFGVVYHVYSVCTYIAKSCWLHICIMIWVFCPCQRSVSKKKKFGCGWAGWGLSNFFWIFGIFNFARPPTQVTEDFGAMEVYCIVHSIDCIITNFFVRFCRTRSSWQRALQSTTFSSPTACWLVGRRH